MSTYLFNIFNDHINTKVTCLDTSRWVFFQKKRWFLQTVMTSFIPSNALSDICRNILQIKVKITSEKKRSNFCDQNLQTVAVLPQKLKIFIFSFFNFNYSFF